MNIAAQSIWEISQTAGLLWEEQWNSKTPRRGTGTASIGSYCAPEGNLPTAPAQPLPREGEGRSAARNGALQVILGFALKLESAELVLQVTGSDQPPSLS